MMTRLQNPTMTVETSAQAHTAACDDPMLNKETGEIRIINIYQGRSITNTLEALQRRNLIELRYEGDPSYRTFYIKLKGA